MPEATRQELSDVAQAAASLARRVDRLNEHIELQKSQVRRTRVMMVIVTVVAIVGLVSSVVTYNLYRDLDDATEQIQTNAQTSCENANRTRESQKYLWDVIIAQSLARDPDRSPEEVKYIEDFQRFINQIFKQRDCEDLDREYPLPKPPKLPGTTSDG